MSLVGFKRMTIRILNDDAPTMDNNLFVVEGTENKGATRKANITGLSSEPTKSYGSDIAYFVSNKGVGDVSVDISAIDLPASMLDKILGYTKKDGVTYIGENTQAPYCSVLLESTTPQGDTALFGLFKGQFSTDSVEMETKEEKQKELQEESLKFTAITADSGEAKGQCVGKYVGKDDQIITKLKQQLKITA